MWGESYFWQNIAFIIIILFQMTLIHNGIQHGLRTPNIDINQRNLKFWVNVAKYALAITINLGLGFDFRLCSEGDFLTGRP